MKSQDRPHRVKYLDYQIVYNPKPIPLRAFDWDFYHSDYDGPGDIRIGVAPSVEEAKARILELIEEESEDGM